jgi:hypothetical protein
MLAKFIGGLFVRAVSEVRPRAWLLRSSVATYLFLTRQMPTAIAGASRESSFAFAMRRTPDDFDLFNEGKQKSRVIEWCGEK